LKEVLAGNFRSPRAETLPTVPVRHKQ